MIKSANRRIRNEDLGEVSGGRYSMTGVYPNLASSLSSSLCLKEQGTRNAPGFLPSQGMAHFLL